jgi:hypothetical protein
LEQSQCAGRVSIPEGTLHAIPREGTLINSSSITAFVRHVFVSKPTRTPKKINDIDPHRMPTNQKVACSSHAGRTIKLNDAEQRRCLTQILFLLIGSEDAVSLIFTLEPSQPVKWASPIPALALPNYPTSVAKWRAVTIRVA